jgi:hypothetical protein
MIYYCQNCKHYWSDALIAPTWDWIYCTKEGYPLMICPHCEKNIQEEKEKPNKPTYHEQKGIFLY